MTRLDLPEGYATARSFDKFPIGYSADAPVVTTLLPGPGRDRILQGTHLEEQQLETLGVGTLRLGYDMRSPSGRSACGAERAPHALGG
jgi:hypothetical protein